MRIARFMPPVMGAAMGAMMLWMLHGALTGESRTSATALLLFVGAHGAILLVLAGLGLWAARFAPRFRARLNRLHRPSLQHVAVMLSAAVVTMGAAHLFLHGGL